MASAEWKRIDRQRQRYTLRAERAAMRALSFQIAPVLNAIKKGSKDPESYAVEGPIRRFYEDIIPLAGKSFAMQVFNQYRMKESAVLIDTKAGVVETIVAETRFVSLLRTYARTQMGKLISGITETTRTIVRSVLNESVTNGWGRDRTAKALRDKWKELSVWRSKLIAQDAIVAASNRGSLFGARAAGIRLQKEWLAADDTRTRQSHRSADGQRREIEELFDINGSELDHPGDTTHGASTEETVACRCAIGYRRRD